jgi:hypothetical protein
MRMEWPRWMMGVAGSFLWVFLSGLTPLDQVGAWAATAPIIASPSALVLKAPQGQPLRAPYR